MKNRLFALLFVVISIFAFTGMASADWTAKITAEGQKIQGQYKSYVTIGVASKEKQTAAPPKAPYFSCNLALIPMPGWTPYLTKDIREDGQESNTWVIAVNPHGNMGGFDDSTATISWDPSQLGDGSFKLVEGLDDSGEVLISDMKTVTSFDVSGWDREFYFTIIQE